MCFFIQTTTNFSVGVLSQDSIYCQFQTVNFLFEPMTLNFPGQILAGIWEQLSVPGPNLARTGGYIGQTAPGSGPGMGIPSRLPLFPSYNLHLPVEKRYGAGQFEVW